MVALSFWMTFSILPARKRTISRSAPPGSTVELSTPDRPRVWNIGATATMMSAFGHLEALPVRISVHVNLEVGQLDPLRLAGGPTLSAARWPSVTTKIFWTRAEAAPFAASEIVAVDVVTACWASESPR